MSLQIIYAGTPDFAVPALKALLQTHHKVIAVYTQPDRPAGRGRKLQASPVKQCGMENNIPIYQPETLKTPENIEVLQSLQPDLMVVAAYGLLLPQKVLDIPRLGCINIHASLLPRWRGAAPIQRAILAGDKTTGVGIMQMEKGLDTGPIWLEKTIAITAKETAGVLQEKLADLGAQALIEVLPLIIEAKTQPQIQNQEGVLYAHKLKKEEAEIHWQESAEQIARQIYAFNPWPIAQTSYKDKKIRIYQAFATEEPSNAIPFGKVVKTDKQGIYIATATTLLCVTELQITGGKVLAAEVFSRGHNLVNEILG